MIKEIVISMKEILEEDFLSGAVVYGDQEPFSIAVQQNLGSDAGDIYASNIFPLEDLQNSETKEFYGTNLLTFHPEAKLGTEWQAFTIDGEKLGFRLRKNYYNANENDARFLIYNEEIGAYMFGGESRIEHMCIFVPRKYAAIDTKTLDDVVQSAERYYKLKTPEYSKGFDTNMNNVLGIVTKRQSGYNLSNMFVSSTGQNFDCMKNHTKLRYFSSWYKLITGKFYKQEELFYTKIDNALLTDAEKQKFYFGKILVEADAPIDENRIETMKQYTDHDASVSARDLIYGTSLSARWLLPEFNETNFITFKNGMKIYLYRTNNEAHQKIVFTVKKGNGEETEEYTLHQVMGSADVMHGPYNVARTSLLQCFLIKAHPGGTPEDKSYGSPYDAGMLFIEPMYNDVPASKISEYIMGLDEPEDSSLWGQYPLAPMRFYSTYTADTDDDCQNKIYGITYSPKFINFTFTGWCSPKRDGGYVNFDSIYHPSYAVAGCDITSKEVWAKIMKFERPAVTPTIPGGGFLGGDGGDGTGDTSDSEDITPSVNPGYQSLGSGVLAYWDIGTKRLDGIRNWITDTALIADFPVSTKMNTICSVKRFMYPFTPQDEGTEQTIYGIDGKPFLNNDGSNFTGKNIDMQYQHNLIGEYTIPKFFDSFLDFAPYTKIKLYLPFAGTIDLNPADVTGRKISIDSGIDWISGNIVYSVEVEGEYAKSILYTASGNCTADIPLSATDFSGRCSALLSATTVAAGSMIGAALIPAASPLAAIGASALAGYKALETGKSDVKQLSGSNVSNNGGLSPMTCYLLIERPVVALPGDAATFASHYGFAASTAGKLINYSGFTQCSDVHLENISCLEEEKSEIEALLKEGVIL